MSEGGNFLGRSIIARGSRTSLVLQYAPDAWVRSYWQEFITHAEGKPFFYGWKEEDYPDDIAFCWVEDDIPPVTHTHYRFAGHSIPIRCQIE